VSLALAYVRKAAAIRTGIEFNYAAWIAAHEPSPAQWSRLAKEVESFQYKPTVSIIMPVFNPPEPYLRAAIESVRRQIYPFWELCIADDCSTSLHVRPVLKEYRHRDERIRVVFLGRRSGISSASNAALALATGDFVGFLDHDDELSPHALLEIVRLLNRNPDLDFIYSDEDKLDFDGTRCDPFFKPEYSPDLLMVMNYITHLSVIRSSLVRAVGGFRLGFEGSQDYDLFLRTLEGARRVGHVPQVLYHWRRSPRSAAGNVLAKTYAYEAAMRALEEAAERRGTPARVSMMTPGHYRVSYRIDGSPQVTIIILSSGRPDALKRSLEGLAATRSVSGDVIVVGSGTAVGQMLPYRISEGRLSYRVVADEHRDGCQVLRDIASEVRSDYLLFLDDTLSPCSGGWLEEMIGYAQRPSVGAVGAKIVSQSGRIIHGGLTIPDPQHGVVQSAFAGLPSYALGYKSLALAVRNCVAVTRACLLTRRSLFLDVGGFDGEFTPDDDIDFCLRLVSQGYWVVWTPFAELVYRGPNEGRIARPQWTVPWLSRRWGWLLADGDPFMSQHLDGSLVHIRA